MSNPMSSANPKPQNDLGALVDLLIASNLDYATFHRRFTNGIADGSKDAVQVHADKIEVSRDSVFTEHGANNNNGKARA